MYANDIKIYSACKNSNKDQVCQALSHFVNIIMEWADAWQISADITKTSVFHIGTEENVEYNFINYILSSVSEVRDLRVVLDRKLNFGTHIDTIARNPFSTLFLIVRSIKNSESLVSINLHKPYVVPLLEYCCQI